MAGYVGLDGDEMEHAAALLMTMQIITQELYLNRDQLTPEQIDGLWDRYHEAEATLHWIIPPAVRPLSS